MGDQKTAEQYLKVKFCEKETEDYNEHEKKESQRRNYLDKKHIDILIKIQEELEAKSDNDNTEYNVLMCSRCKEKVPMRFEEHLCDVILYLCQSGD